jgi:hypothetical protein
MLSQTVPQDLHGNWIAKSVNAGIPLQSHIRLPHLGQGSSISLLFFCVMS